MSLKQNFPERIPESTRRIAEALLGDGSVYRWRGEHMPEILDEAD
jgi:hypothetical protein